MITANLHLTPEQVVLHDEQIGLFEGFKGSVDNEYNWREKLSDAQKEERRLRREENPPWRDYSAGARAMMRDNRTISGQDPGLAREIQKFKQARRSKVFEDLKKAEAEYNEAHVQTSDNDMLAEEHFNNNYDVYISLAIAEAALSGVQINL